MKAIKVELLIIDHDECGIDEIKEIIENQRFPNYCINPNVMNIEEKDIGEWEDSNPLNNCDKMKSEYEKLFEDK